jgi:hypothetical protein
VNNEFWMPAPSSGQEDFEPFVYQPMTSREEAVLRRLKRRPGTASFRPGRVRERVALRLRRRVLNRLARSDLRSLVHIVMELGL